MLGTIANSIAIVIGTMVGLLFKKGIKEEYSEIIVQATSLGVLIIGIKGALQGQELLLMIFSLVIGSIIGEWIHFENKLKSFGDFIESKFSKGESSISKGFVSATLIFCVGSMAIVGALESGLRGNHEILFAKATLDGIFSVIFASTLGIGVMLSAVSVFIYQGAIAMSSSLVAGLLTDQVVTEVAAVGSILIMVIGTNMLEMTKIRVANMIPAVFIPVVYFGILNFL